MREGMKALRFSYGSDIPDPTHYIASNWTHDTHTYGAYPFWVVSERP